MNALSAATTEHVRVPLPGGVLTAQVEPGAWRLDELCGFAARRNARRGFLVVSKVLGRHIAARPSVMRAAARDLVATLPTDLPGPVLVLGLAETAVCLGQTVHEELRLGTGRDDVAFLHSTRQARDRPLLAQFQEPHSHAPAHLIYAPLDVFVAQAVEAAKSLVLVDDEASTGTTFANLATALCEVLPKLETVVTAVLTDWSGGAYLADMPRPAQARSLLTGRLHWKAHATTQPNARPSTAAGFGEAPTGAGYGRFGALRALQVDSRLVDHVRPTPGRRLLVVGTGEFAYPPFCLAERLESEGVDVQVQCVSRTPAQLGGALQRVTCLPDPYGSTALHHLYNAQAATDLDVVVAHETPDGSIDPEFLSALSARAVRFEAHP